jgi:hypothetical protein
VSRRRGLDEVWPSEHEARAVAVYLRRADDFEHAPVDWLAVTRLGAHLISLPDPQRWPPEPPPRAKAAVETRHAIRTGERPAYAGQEVSYETLGAIYFLLTAGQYTKDCPNFLSPQGRHRWRFCDPDDGDKSGLRQCCDYCGDARTLPLRARR